MGESNFSRAFEHVTDDDDQSPIQELVFTAVEFLLTVPDFPKGGTQREQLVYVHECFKGRDLDLATPRERKDDARAEKCLVATTGDPLSKLNEALRFARPESSGLLYRAYWQRGLHFQTKGSFENAAENFEEASQLSEDCSELLRIYHRLAQCYSKAKRYPDSVAALRKALCNLDKAEMEADMKKEFRKLLDDSVAKMSRKKTDICSISTKTILKPHDPQPDMPSLSRLVLVRETPRQGRFAVAVADIAAGTLLVVDEPVVSLLNPDDRSAAVAAKFCCRCLNNQTNPFPCHSCSAVAFCSKSCRREAREIHDYECRLNLYQHRISDQANSCRIFLTLRTFLQYDVLAVRAAFLGKAEYQGEDICALERLFNMVTHVSERDEDDRLKYLVLSSLILRLLRKCGYPISESGLEEADMLEMIHRLLQIHDVNTHPVFSLDEMATSQVGLSKIGSSVNTNIGSFFNHSCNPNTCRVNQGRRTLLVATRNIREGEEISDIYSMHYSETPLMERRQWLRDNFFFECRCEACFRKWPSYDRLPSELKPQLLEELTQLERAIHAALRGNDIQAGLSLHLKDLALIETLKEPHRLHVSVRNSLQFCLWRLYCNCS